MQNKSSVVAKKCSVVANWLQKNEWVAKKKFGGCKLVAKKPLVVKMVAKLQKKKESAKKKW